MILVYPMLTSASVNPTLLPGIIKAIEKYIIIHNTDDVLNHFNSVATDIAKTAATSAGGQGTPVGGSLGPDRRPLALPFVRPLSVPAAD